MHTFVLFLEAYHAPLSYHLIINFSTVGYSVHYAKLTFFLSFFLSFFLRTFGSEVANIFGQRFKLSFSTFVKRKDTENLKISLIEYNRRFG